MDDVYGYVLILVSISFLFVLGISIFSESRSGRYRAGGR